MSNVLTFVKSYMFVCIIGNKYIDRCFLFDFVDALMMLIFGSLPFVLLLPVMKYAICSLIIGPLILLGTTPLCHGSILSVNLTVPIVAFCSQFLVYVKNFPSF